MKATVLIAILLAAQGPKDIPAEPPLTEDEMLAILKEKGEFSWAENEYRLKAKKVQDKDLIEMELVRLADGKPKHTLTARKARLKADKEGQKLTIYFDEGEIMVTNDKRLTYFRDQQMDFPLPRRGKRP